MKKNENCFIGMPSCGNVYESAKMVFVAAPADDLYKLKISHIKRVVESQGLECYLALRNFEPGSFAFCTKICSKIIQSRFCIVLLDPSLKGSINIPNPNVNLEYGMMIAQNKFIIPLQEEKHILPFNISPLDTVKYNDSNFEEKVVSAVDHAINRKNKSEQDDNDPLQIVQNYYAIEGYTLSDINGNVFLKSLFSFGQPYGYNLFDNSNEYIFVGNFNKLSDENVIGLKVKILIDTIVKKYDSFKKTTDVKEFEKSYGYLVNAIKIMIVVPDKIEKDKLFSKIIKIVNKEYSYSIEINHLNSLKEVFDKKLKMIFADPNKKD